MIQGIQHFGITVSNLDEVLHFFCDILGMEKVLVKEAKGERGEVLMGMPGISLRITVLRAKDQKDLEFIEYLSPKGEKLDLRTCNVGVPHLAFVVDDINRTYRELSALGYEFNSPPYWEGASVAGQEWGVCFVKGPDNIPIELMQPPK